MTNSADPDQLASSEANWSGSTLFAKTGHVVFSKRRVKKVLFLLGALHRKKKLIWKLLSWINANPIVICKLLSWFNANPFVVTTYAQKDLSDRPRWLSWMRRPTGDQDVAGSTPGKVGNILSWRLIMKYFLRSFSLFRWFKKGSCQFLAKECAQCWLTLRGLSLPSKRVAR